jgi:hypothetical protein
LYFPPWIRIKFSPRIRIQEYESGTQKKEKFRNSEELDVLSKELELRCPFCELFLVKNYDLFPSAHFFPSIFHQSLPCSLRSLDPDPQQRIK